LARDHVRWKKYSIPRLWVSLVCRGAKGGASYGLRRVGQWMTAKKLTTRSPRGARLVEGNTRSLGKGRKCMGLACCGGAGCRVRRRDDRHGAVWAVQHEAGLHHTPYDGHRMEYVVCRMGLIRGSYGGGVRELCGWCERASLSACVCACPDHVRCTTGGSLSVPRARGTTERWRPHQSARRVPAGPACGGGRGVEGRGSLMLLLIVVVALAPQLVVVALAPQRVERL
jgi:hypothetical protein